LNGGRALHHIQDKPVSQLEKNLNLALELSREILHHANKEAWSEIEPLDRQRMQLLESIFSDAEFKANRQVFAEFTGTVKELNDKAMEICNSARGVAMADSRKVKLGKEALVAYKKYNKSK
jgi:hypothetical protein